MKNLKTTITGLSLITISIVRLYFAIKLKQVDEVTITGCIGGIAGGIGLVFAKDSGTPPTTTTTS